MKEPAKTKDRQFASDNGAGICPEAWGAMERANHGHAPGYGDDAWTQRAADLIRATFETDCDVYFAFNGTAANSMALASLCQSYHGVICHETAHVEVDECGAPEFFSGGSKILVARGEHGRIDPQEVEALCTRRSDVHFPRPRALSLTQATELGTVYSLAHLEALRETAGRHGLNVHMDGARFANAVASMGVAPKALTWERGVDVLSFGGTKNGMAVGEAVVFFDRELAREFDLRCKQAGQLASKMRFLAAPWVGMLEDGAWLRHAAHANGMAERLEGKLREMARELTRELAEARPGGGEIEKGVRTPEEKGPDPFFNSNAMAERLEGQLRELAREMNEGGGGNLPEAEMGSGPLRKRVLTPFSQSPFSSEMAFELPHPREANAVFARLPKAWVKGMYARGWRFHDFFAGGLCRFMCSWDTTEGDVDGFVGDLRDVAGVKREEVKK